MLDKELVRRFHKKYRKDESGCWLWTASTAGRGYGQIKLSGERRQVYAHRLSYLIHVGDPGDEQVLHRCDNPLCVNPKHLFLGSAADNAKDMRDKGRHLYGERNTQAKLDDKMVREIKAMLGIGIPQKRISAAYGVHQVHVSRINTGKRWAHVK